MKENTTEMEPPIQRSPGIDITGPDVVLRLNLLIQKLDEKG